MTPKQLERERRLEREYDARMAAVYARRDAVIEALAWIDGRDGEIDDYWFDAMMICADEIHAARWSWLPPLQGVRKFSWSRFP
jgi:hypothetical protein